MNEKEMTELLAKKLSREEFMVLFMLMDTDPPAGPFWESVAEKAEELCPEEFNSHVEDESLKEQLDEPV